VAGLRGRSLALGDAEATLSAWAKTLLVDADLYGKDLRKYDELDSTKGPPERASANDKGWNAHAKVIEAVRNGDCDAGVARVKNVKSELGQEGKDWIALAHYNSVPDIWSAARGVPSQVAEAFTRALIRITRDQTALPTSSVGFLPVTPATLREFEKVSRAVELFGGKGREEEK
jgi:hypothetical protein